MKAKSVGLLLFLAAALWLLTRLPNPATDVGRLEPVEVVQLTASEDGILIQTDTGAWGAGNTLADAVRALQKAEDREVFLETADKILLLGEPEGYWQEIYGRFRPGSQICRVTGETDLEAAGRYLTIHPTTLTLGKLRAQGGTPQILILTEGRGILVPEE